MRDDRWAIWQRMMLHPEGSRRAVWNVMMSLLIVYCAIAVPLEIVSRVTAV